MTELYAGAYLEMNIVCMLLLGFVLFADARRYDRSMGTILFDYAVVATFLILSFDAVWVAVENCGLPDLRWVNAFVDACYLFLAVMVSYLWMMYLEYCIRDNIRLPKRIEVLLAIPAVVVFFLSFGSLFTGWMFFVDASNVYHRGALYLAQPIVSYAYLIGAAIHIAIKLVGAAKRDKRKYRILLSFFVLPSIAGVTSVFYPGLPLVWPAVTLSALMVYQNYQSSQISTDALTGLNNRRKFDRYFQTIMESRQSNDCAYLILADVDNFKQINDCYGHTEGDKALVRVATGLRKTCGKARDAFLARYGGDEFAIVLRCQDEYSVQSLAVALQEACNITTAEDSSDYVLMLSIGYAACPQEESTDFVKVIEQADRMLYEEKQLHHKNAMSGQF